MTDVKDFRAGMVEEQVREVFQTPRQKPSILGSIHLTKLD